MANLHAGIERTVLHPTVSVANLDKAIGEVRQYGLAGLCVPPFWVKKVKRDLGDCPAYLATVVGFPFGYQRTEAKITEIEFALQDGATDLQVTMNTSALFSPTSTWIKIELAKCAALAHAHHATLTVIMEGSLLEEEHIQRYCKVSADAGVDFIKNATGFLTGSLLVSSLLDQIRLFRQSLPESVKIKAVSKVHSMEEIRRLLGAGAERVCVDGPIGSLQ